MLYAEVFGYEEEIAALIDKVDLGSRGDYDVFDIAVSDSRDLISVLLYNNVSSFCFSDVNDNALCRPGPAARRTRS